MDKQILLTAAALRIGSVEICGQMVHYREPSALTRMDYLNEQKTLGKEKAIANFIRACVTDPYLTAEEADLIAGGSDRVFAPLVNALLKEEGEEEVKKDLLLTGDSASD